MFLQNDNQGLFFKGGAGATPQEGFFTNHLLIAAPAQEDKFFAKSVVYLCAHSTAGAVGIVLNQTMPDIHFSDFKKTKKITTEIINLFKQFKLDLNKSKILNEFELIENKLFEAFTFENIEWFNEEKNKRLELKI